MYIYIYIQTYTNISLSISLYIYIYIYDIRGSNQGAARAATSLDEASSLHPSKGIICNWGKDKGDPSKGGFLNNPQWGQPVS